MKTRILETCLESLLVISSPFVLLHFKVKEALWKQKLQHLPSPTPQQAAAKARASAILQELLMTENISDEYKASLREEIKQINFV